MIQARLYKIEDKYKNILSKIEEGLPLNTLGNDEELGSENFACIVYAGGEAFNYYQDPNHKVVKNFLKIISDIGSKFDFEKLSIQHHGIVGGLISLGILCKHKETFFFDLLEDRLQEMFRRNLVIKSDYIHNFEVFNAAIALFRNLICSDDVLVVEERVLKLCKSFNSFGYFDDNVPKNNFNNYGFMVLSFLLKMNEIKPFENYMSLEWIYDFKRWSCQYIELIKALINPKGLGFPYGRSIGWLGQMQPLCFIEQVMCSSLNFSVNVVKLASVRNDLFDYMLEEYFDEKSGRFILNDKNKTCYKNRTNESMLFDCARYLYQLNNSSCNKRSVEFGKEDYPLLSGNMESCKEIVFFEDGDSKSAVFVYQNNNYHIVLPTVGTSYAGSNGDTLPIPYSKGLIESVAQNRLPVLTPRIRIEGVDYWSNSLARFTRIVEKEKSVSYFSERNYWSDVQGRKFDLNISLLTKFEFFDHKIIRHDVFKNPKGLKIESLDFYILEACKGKQLFPKIGSSVKELVLAEPVDVSNDDSFKNFWGHIGRSWHVSSTDVIKKKSFYITTQIEF